MFKTYIYVFRSHLWEVAKGTETGSEQERDAFRCVTQLLHSPSPLPSPLPSPQLT
jgi:hypothetical protein